MKTLKNKIVLGISILCMVTFFITKSLIIFNIYDQCSVTNVIEYFSFIIFCPMFYIFICDFIKMKDKIHQETLDQLQYKNTYLEHAAKILRHDMHSGINVYIPRGVSALDRRLPESAIKEYKLEAPLKLLREGLSHTQKVYKGVYEFTNLVKEKNGLKLTSNNLNKILSSYLESTTYKDQVVMDKLPTINVNESLFCTAIDNLIRNGLKYNDNQNKMVAIYMIDDKTLVVQDNGRGMTQEEFLLFSKTNTRRENQKENGSGLGLGICVAILKEHKFDVSCEKLEEGSQIKIKIK